jgi:hypothetical protein
MDEPDSLASKLEAEIERKLSHERFRSPRRVGERPLDRKLADFLVVRVAVGAAAVVEVAAAMAQTSFGCGPYPTRSPPQ